MTEPRTDQHSAPDPGAATAGVKTGEVLGGNGSPPKDRNGGDEVLDFSNEKPSPQATYDVKIGGDYDPRPHEDSARRYIAYLLIWLLWLIVAGMLILVAFGTIKVGELKEFAVLLGPVVTLVSAATGFYYGTKSSGPR